MKALYSRSLTRSAVACRVYLPHLNAYEDATLVRVHASENVLLELPWRIPYITSGHTVVKNGVYVTELVSEKGMRYYVQSRAGDAWAMIHDLPQVSPEVETAHAIAI